MCRIRPDGGAEMPGKLTDDQTARCLSAIVAAHPALHAEAFTVLTHSWDSIAIALGPMTFKFPQSEPAAASLRREVALLRVIRPRLSVPVPDMALFEGPPVFSAHPTLPGDHLPPDAYAALPEAAKARLGVDARQVLRATCTASPTDLDASRRRPARAGGGPNPDVLLDTRCSRRCPNRCAPAPAMSSGSMPPSAPIRWVRPAVTSTGTAGTWPSTSPGNALPELYDFADAGIGPVHREFVYPGFIARDLVLRIVAAYAAETGRRPDQRRIDILTAALRLSELAGATGNPDHLGDMRRNAVEWLALMA